LAQDLQLLGLDLQLPGPVLLLRQQEPGLWLREQAQGLVQELPLEQVQEQSVRQGLPLEQTQKTFPEGL
jgi:hypothetical protein